MSVFDYVLIAVYFVFMLLTGVLFKRHTRDTSDYFRGGGVMTWWLIGASSFVQTFSAWSFVGLAGAVYSRGSLLAWVYFSNIAGLLVCMLYTAARFRRLRVITWVEALRDRYGVKTEQFYAYVQLFNGFILGGGGLYILSIFVSAMFNIDVRLTVILVGVIVTIMSVSGGSWAVTASDFVQSLVIVAVVCVISILTLCSPDVGGISGFIRQVPETHWRWGFDVPGWVLGIWMTLMTLNGLMTMNSLSTGAARLILVKDEKSAVRSLYISIAGYIVLPFLILIPSLAAVFLFPNIDALYPQLNFPKEAAYAATAMHVLPNGMLGMLACAMFAATMSSMDTALNRNAGIFVKNIYQRLIRPRCGEKEAILTGKIYTAIFGGVLIFSALKFSEMKEMPIFETLAFFGALLSQPLLIPLVLGLFIRRTPPWAAISTVAIGFVTGLTVMKAVPVVALAESWFGPLTPQARIDLSFMIPSLSVILVSFCWFLLSTRFYKEPDALDEGARRKEDFFVRQKTPIDIQAEGLVENDQEQASILGWLSAAYGIFIMTGALIPNRLSGRLTFLGAGGAVLLVGLGLLGAARRKKEEAR